MMINKVISLRDYVVVVLLFLCMLWDLHVNLMILATNPNYPQPVTCCHWFQWVNQFLVTCFAFWDNAAAHYQNREHLCWPGDFMQVNSVYLVVLILTFLFFACAPCKQICSDIVALTTSTIQKCKYHPAALCGPWPCFVTITIEQFFPFWAKSVHKKKRW